MVTAGIIAEYNPFHPGHRYHIRETRKSADAVVVAMSGAFMQRGEPALFDMFRRAEAAVKGGADLVLQLPVYSSLQGGYQFAAGGVSLLGRTHTSSILSFGIESDKPEFLILLKDFLKNETDFYIDLLKSQLRQGYSYAVARQKAVSAVLGPETASELEKPNNILALEYLLALEKLHINMKPCFIKRTGAGHDILGGDDPLPSALSIRRAYEKDGFAALCPLLPDSADYENAAHVGANAFETELLYLLRTMETCPDCPDMHGEMWSLLTEAARRLNRLEDVIAAAEARQFNRSRIKRALMQMLVGIDRSDAEEMKNPTAIRVLAFNDTGRLLLRQMQKEADFRPVTNIDRTVQQDKSLSLDLRAHMLWSAAAGLNPLYSWQTGPVYLPGKHEA